MKRISVSEREPLLASINDDDHRQAATLCYSPQHNDNEQTSEDSPPSGATKRPRWASTYSYDDTTYQSLRRRHWKNLILLGVSFLAVFTSYQSLQNLKSTLNRQGSVGRLAIGVLYAGVTVGCLVAPIVIEKIGPKYGILSAMVAQAAFAAANFYPRLALLIPISLALGVTSAFMWIGVGVYITRLAISHARLLEEDDTAVLTTFNGIFVAFFQEAQVVGNLISSLVLHTGQHTDRNGTVNSTEDSVCGASFCNSGNSSGSHQTEPPENKIYMLLGVYTGSCVLATLITLCGVDSSTSEEDGEDGAPSNSLCRRLLATLTKHTDPMVTLLLPLFLYNGLEQSFLAGDYTQAFVGCELGIGSIGYTMMTYGGANVLACLCLGNLEKLLGRVLLFVTAACFNLGVLIFLLRWRVYDGPNSVFYVIPALWGVGDAIWQTSTGSLMGKLFGESGEDAWAVYRLWQSMGLGIGFVTTTFVCVNVKIYMMLGVLSIGIAMYGGLEFGVKRRKGGAWYDIDKPYPPLSKLTCT